MSFFPRELSYSLVAGGVDGIGDKGIMNCLVRSAAEGEGPRGVATDSSTEDGEPPAC